MRLFNRERHITNAPMGFRTDSKGRSYTDVLRPGQKTAKQIAKELNASPTSPWKDVRVLTPAHDIYGAVLPEYGEVVGRRRKKPVKIGPFTIK